MELSKKEFLNNESYLPDEIHWHSRGYLPHFEADQFPQSITFRLFDSLPATVLKDLRETRYQLSTNRKKIESYLDKGLGEAWLSNPVAAKIVEENLLWFDNRKYYLHAWAIMPNHVHVLITPCRYENLSGILHSWKSYTAKKVNHLLRRSGSLWQEEYFDRLIRNEKHFNATVNYIEYNPVKAGLCEIPERWSFSSARLRINAVH